MSSNLVAAERQTSKGIRESILMPPVRAGNKSKKPSRVAVDPAQKPRRLQRTIRAIRRLLSRRMKSWSHTAILQPSTGIKLGE